MHRKVVYLDEINFTKRSVMQRDWSRKDSNLAIDQQEIYIGYRSVIASMTAENGIGCIRIFSQAVTAEDFVDFLKSLRARYHKRPLALFMDQLAVHKSKEVKPWYISLNITPIYNVAYSPEFNPIEAVFSQVKAIFNRRRLNCLVNKIGFNADETIRVAFNAVNKDHCAACARKSRELLEKASLLE